ncbi:glycosyltransferase [Psychroserpens sp. SPM9]|uniref:glycosyltransferase n=1 Tax=Psychroserpens sp. SPM9 TaxID=2975598 RepID=UPI0021A80723|nr:glycosyltransferase [Psychroserpens sp. SPM9]MDG5492228.1 glycosyltransferase [Psychroserpens sp. SPM9]
MSTLTIISHTEHYKTPNGQLVGLGSTVTELNHLVEVFDEVIHVAMLYDSLAPASALPYTSDKIKFVPLPALGGSKLSDKLAILWKAPSVLKIISSALDKTDYFQFRAPTGIGVFVIPYLMFKRSKKGWFKYAGNWKQEQAPLAYRFQRWLLKQQSRKVTINGKWEHQKSQCLTFENPCLTEQEIAFGNEVIQGKSLEGEGLNFCFVGRLEEEKGIGLLIQCLSALSKTEKTMLNTIHIVGDGKAKERYQKQADESGLNFIFHGFISRKEVHKIYQISHAILLPSASEGFPKVIAEAMNYGCLPMVSNISSIADYVKDEINGFLFFPITFENLTVSIKKMLNLSDFQYHKMIQAQNQELIKFTYSYYNKRIREELL